MSRLPILCCDDEVTSDLEFARKTQLAVDPVEFLDVGFRVGFWRKRVGPIQNFESTQRAELVLAAGRCNRQLRHSRRGEQGCPGFNPDLAARGHEFYRKFHGPSLVNPRACDQLALCGLAATIGLL